MAGAKRAAVKKAPGKLRGEAVDEGSRGAEVAARAGAESAADVVDAQLAKYRSMRDFHITEEPAGGAKDGTASKAALPFCIQKHAASHLHYDFRLGWNGVLKSWAVAKGPSYVVADKRLAVQVEDHPMEYGGFEGIIPAGQYGGGTVMLVGPGDVGAAGCVSGRGKGASGGAAEVPHARDQDEGEVGADPDGWEGGDGAQAELAADQGA